MAIARSTANINEMIQNISHASNEQTHGVGQIHIAINELDNTTQANAAMTKELQGSLQSLKTQSELLEEIIATFTLNLPLRQPNRITKNKPYSSKQGSYSVTAFTTV